jgi:hypothetical protein
VDANEKDVLGIEVTTEDYSDSEMFESLVTQVDGEIARIYYINSKIIRIIN